MYAYLLTFFRFLAKTKKNGDTVSYGERKWVLPFGKGEAEGILTDEQALHSYK